eukprot:SAG11_NODE_27324_length_334_cov_0.489362_2_plen_50_part_01
MMRPHARSGPQMGWAEHDSERYAAVFGAPLADANRAGRILRNQARIEPDR